MQNWILLSLGEKGAEWNLEMVDIMARSLGSGYLFINAVKGRDYRADISIDNLMLSQGQCCPRKSVIDKATFPNGLNVCLNKWKKLQVLGPVYTCDF